MKRSSSEQFKTVPRINRTPVGSESFGGLPRKHTRAFEALQNSCVELFTVGKNTMEIASQVKATEAQVYNILARLGQ